MLRVLLLCGIVANSALAQTPSRAAKAEIVNGMSGLINPRLVGQQVLFDVGSNPKIGQIALITVDNTAKSSLVVVMKTVYDVIQLRPSADGTYGFSGEGRYAVHVTIVDMNGNLAFESFPIELNVSEPINPVEPDENSLSQVAKSSREAMRKFVENVAANYKILSIDTQAGKFRTVGDASMAANTLDLSARNQFKKTMADIMQPVLGNDKLPNTASKTFEDIARGFGGVK